MKQKPPYRAITQKPYCCVPACITMVLNRRKIKHRTQEEIGHELGLVVPKNKVHLFNKVRTGRKPAAGYGTQVGRKQYSISKYFKNNHIKLKEKYYSLNDIKDIKTFIKNHIRKNNDILVCFHNKTLFGFGDYGHVCPIESINTNAITLINPEQDELKRKWTELPNLILAIKMHGKMRRGGFWIISK